MTAVMPALAAERHRAEPSLGRLDDIATAAERPRQSARTPARKPGGVGRWIFLAAIVTVLGLGGALAWRHQDRLRALLPDTELNDLLARGDTALAANRLTGTTGDSARELFEAARRIDPDNEIARAGLRRVGEALLAQAHEAVARHDFATARARLADARGVLAGGLAVEQGEAELKQAESQGTHVEELLGQADAALAQGRLLEAGGAVDLYGRVLAADAGNALAQAGLKKAGTALATQIRELITAGKLDEAATRTEDFARALPADAALPALRGELAKARDEAQTAFEARVRRGQDLLRSGKAVGNGEDNALAQFQAVLARDPGNAKARAGLGQVAQALIVQANAALDDDKPDPAQRLLDQAAQLAPGSAELAAARSRLREVREQRDIAAARAALTPEQQQRLTRLIAEADQAAATGRLMLPPGECAYDKYRAALAIDGNNAQALAGLQGLPQRAREQFTRAIDEAKPDRARDLVETLAQLSPGDAALPGMRARLADAYLDEAETRIGESRPAEARRALEAARKLAAGNPRLGVLEQRLRELQQRLPDDANGAQRP